MTVSFDPSFGAIAVEAVLVGPSARIQLTLILDTGASSTLISEERLRAAGCAVDQPVGTVHATFGSGTESIPIVVASSFQALGVTIAAYRVMCHTLPASAGVDGVLGLDFFEGHVLTLDFINHRLDLA